MTAWRVMNDNLARMGHYSLDRDSESILNRPDRVVLILQRVGPDPPPVDRTQAEGEEIDRRLRPALAELPAVKERRRLQGLLTEVRAELRAVQKELESLEGVWRRTVRGGGDVEEVDRQRRAAQERARTWQDRAGELQDGLAEQSLFVQTEVQHVFDQVTTDVYREWAEKEQAVLAEMARRVGDLPDQLREAWARRLGVHYATQARKTRMERIRDGEDPAHSHVADWLARVKTPEPVPAVPAAELIEAVGAPTEEEIVVIAPEEPS
jgi:hypothetical protein